MLANQNPGKKHQQMTRVTSSYFQDERESFVWSDREVELLLSVTLEYKTGKIQENINGGQTNCKHRSHS